MLTHTSINICQYLTILTIDRSTINPSQKPMVLQSGPPYIAKLVNITRLTMVYGTYNYG